MATKTEYLTFYIVLSDPERVKQLQAQYPIGVNRAPYNPNVNGTGQPGGAAIEFEAPFKGYTDVGLVAPYSWTPWSGYGTQGGPYPLDVATFQRKTGGFFGLFGTTIRYYWIGQFVLAAPATADTINGTTNADVTDLAVTRWIDGFEGMFGGPLNGTNLPDGMAICRDAARHVGGFGLALRGQLNTGQSDGPQITTTAGHWERMYLRLRNKPTSGATTFWTVTNSIGGTLGGDGVDLQIDGAGAILCVDVDNQTGVPVRTVLGSVTTLEQWTGRADHHAWIRLDIIVAYVGDVAAPTGITPGTIKFFVNGIEVATYGSAVAGHGLNRATATYRQSHVGNNSAAAGNLELDIDDWRGAAIPSKAGAFHKKGRDWLNGTKIIGVFGNAFSGSHAGWTGDIRVVSQLQPYTATNGPTLTSTTANALAEVVADVSMLKRDKDIIGFTGAFNVVSVTTRGVNNGTQGYKLNGAAPVDAAITQAAAATYAFVQRQTPAGQSALQAIDTLTLRHTKGNDAGAATVKMLMAQVEAVGIFGPEDYRTTENGPDGTPKFPDFVGQHNAAYPLSQYVKDPAAPVLGPYIVQSGTYVGNGTGQDLLFRGPVNWIFIRNISTSQGAQWWSSMIGAHTNYTRGVDASITGYEEDLSFAPVAAEDQQQQRYKIKLAGASANYNQNAVTYQYVAVIDPAQRYMLNGGFSHRHTAGARANFLINDLFSPDWVFIWGEKHDATAGASMFAKMPGANLTNDLAIFGGAKIATALNAAAGVLNSDVNLHNVFAGIAQEFAYSCWRKHDGNNDPGEAAVFTIGTYTGDGGASRTINLGTGLNKRPIFAFVVSEGSTSYQRDVSHTGTNSTNSAGTQNATGITGGGIDQLSVGTTLNTNAVVFTYFILWGDATAGNGGFGVNGEYVPVESASPIGGLTGSTNPTPDEAAVIATNTDTPAPELVPAIPDDISSDLGVDCIIFTTAIANLALSRIGVSKRLQQLATENTEAADLVRLTFGIVASQVLRAFDWPFATKYADLVLVGGTETDPVNLDWQYSYRAPSDMVKARRIVGQSGQRRTYDPNPITFRIGGDATGELVYTNAAALDDDTPVQLEYTRRVPCVAGAGDGLFRSALAWMLASEIAPSLSKDPNRSKFCLGMYQATLSVAGAKGAGEQQQEHQGDADWITGRE